MDVLFGLDNNYCQHACVVIASLCDNNEGHHIFHIITDTIDKKNQTKLEFFCHERKCEIYFYFLTKEMFSFFPIGKETANTYISIAAYFRLFIIDILPKTVERVLYLDCDVCVLGKLNELWNYQFDAEECVYALEESPRLAVEGCHRLGYPKDYSYFNSGVILFELNNLRRYFSIAAAVAFMKDHKLLFHDQDILNGLLYNHKSFMPLKYNVIDSYMIVDAEFPKRYRSEISERNNPVIIHFSGPFKPWFYECKNPYRFVYDKYLALTPYKDAPKMYKNKHVLDKILYLFNIKRIVKIILSIVHIKDYSFISVSSSKDC